MSDHFPFPEEIRPLERMSLKYKLAWFFALWAGSVIGLGIVSYGIKLLLK